MAARDHPIAAAAPAAIAARPSRRDGHRARAVRWEALAAPAAAEPDIRSIDAALAPLAAAEAPKYVWPLENADAAVTDPYGMRVHPLTKTEQFHSGIDLAAEGGENVLAVADGTVLDCSYNEAYGYVLTLGHADGVQTQYAHLRAFLVSPGDTVVQGQAVALVGAPGWATALSLRAPRAPCAAAVLRSTLR